MSALDLAELYARDLGWPVFPLAPRSKKPATEHGFRDATLDGEQVRRWWRERPDLGVGIACAGVVVLDVDVRDGKPGKASLDELERAHGDLPETWTATTPSGGLHFYFAQPAQRLNRAIGVRPGLDLLGVGGYVCAPPTVTGEGSYRWTDCDAALAPLPSWLAGLSRTPAIATTTAAQRGRWEGDVEARARRAIAYVERCDPAVSGQGGHDQTFRVALAVVRGFDLPRPVAREVLRWYGSRCLPPWSARELEHKLDSAEAARIASGYLLEGARA